MCNEVGHSCNACSLNVWLMVTCNEYCGLFKQALFTGVHRMDIPKTPRFEFGALFEV